MFHYSCGLSDIYNRKGFCYCRHVMQRAAVTADICHTKGCCYCRHVMQRAAVTADISCKGLLLQTYVMQRDVVIADMSCKGLLLLTPWCRVLLEKLTGLQLVKKFPAFHQTRRFITAHTSVRHLSLSWASPICMLRDDSPRNTPPPQIRVGE